MIPREILGPQDHYERSGAQSLRDIRPLTVRLASGLAGQFSALLLGGAAGLMVVVPATVDLVVPLAAIYTVWVLTRRVKLPLRLPKSARRRDWNYPDPATRQPRRAAGSIYLGRDATTGKELWITSDDGRQHGTIPGTTGGGKTSAILSFVANALTHASGFTLVDGKADNKLFTEVSALARRFGRDDDVLALNFLVASGVKDSNTFNPFSTGNADSIRELLASQLGEQRAEDPNGVFRARAIALVGTMAPVLTWMRDNKGIPINIEKIRSALELRSIWKIATRRIFEVRDPETGRVEEIPVPDLPEDLVYPLQAYLGEIPGYDTSLDYNQQKTDKPLEQHGYALFYFTATFTQLAVSLGHIFKVETGDIIMRDVVLNRRILVCNLPALENSDDTLAALGRIVVASKRGMMAETLGARLEGDYAEIVGSKAGMGSDPYQVVFDEITYYATSGQDRMLAMGRGLNMMFWLAFQEVSGMWARLGEKTQSLLGNANLTVALRQQDANRTRTWLEQTAGQTNVTQATSYHGGGAGEYREAQHAEVRQVSRVDWNDLQRLIEGEAIVLFGGRRIYAKLFYARVDPTGPIRLNRPVMLREPDPAVISTAVGRIRTLTTTLERGLVAVAAQERPTPALSALLAAFGQAARQGHGGEDCAVAAITAAGAAPTSPADQTPGEDGRTPPHTPFTRMLDHASESVNEGGIGGGTPADPVDAALFADLYGIGLATGLSRTEAREIALAVLAERDACEPPPARPTPPPMTAQELRARVERLTAILRTSIETDEAERRHGT